MLQVQQQQQKKEPLSVVLSKDGPENLKKYNTNPWLDEVYFTQSFTFK